MGEIRIVGPGKTRGYPYPVCKKARVNSEVKIQSMFIIVSRHAKETVCKAENDISATIKQNRQITYCNNPTICPCSNKRSSSLFQK